MAGLNPLFHRPRPMRIVLQKFFVVIRFDHERLHRAQSFNDHFCWITEIGNETETARAGVKGEPDRIDCVVRHGKRLHGDVTDRELRARSKNSPLAMLFEQPIVPDRFGRQRVAINRYVEFAAENLESADVIAMFMREQNAVELFGCHATVLETENNLSRAQPAIEENFAMIGRDQCAIARAAAAEHGQAEHGS